MARILHIEDDPSSRLLVRKLLTAAGHEVVDAASGLEGVRLASEGHADLILLDINIPDLDGYEVALRLRGTPRLADVPIVAITAEGDRDTSLAVGCDGFLEKPIDARKFPRAVARFLAGHREKASDVEPRLREASQRIVERLEAKVKALSEANARLEELARVRREYLRNLSHELATPMTPVVGYLKLLLAGELGELTPTQRKALLSIDAGASRLRSMVDTLLDVSSLETGRLHFYARDYDFAKVARRTLDETRPRFVERQLTVSERVPKGPLKGRGDPEKLRRALAHLLDNALKFTPTSGALAVEVTEEDDAFCFRVADSGVGVPRAQHEKVLEPFYQVDGSVTRTHGGVGLGLAFARRVAEAHDGQVLLTSPPSGPVAGVRLLGTEVAFRVRAAPRLPDAPPDPAWTT